VPALNEAPQIEYCLRSLNDQSIDKGCYEIIVVDDGSMDGTGEAARTAKLPNEIDLRIANHRKNLGKGAAVRTGFGLSAGKWVLLTDADLSTPIEELPLLVSAAEDGGVAIGSRAVQRHLVEVRQPRHRDFMGRTFNLIVRTLGLTTIHDTQCGFKLFPGKELFKSHQCFFRMKEEVSLNDYGTNSIF